MINVHDAFTVIVQRLNLEHFDTFGTIVILKQVLLKGLPHMDVNCICNLLISYWSGPPSGCVEGLLMGSFLLHLWWITLLPNKCWLGPFLKNRPAKMGRRKLHPGALGATSPHFHLFPCRLNVQTCPPESTLGTGSLHKWAQDTTGRLCGGCLFLLCALCSCNLILSSHAHTDTPSLMLHLQYPSPSLPPISTHTHTRFLWIKQGAPLPLVLSCCDGEVHPHLIMYQREDRGRELWPRRMQHIHYLAFTDTF